MPMRIALVSPSPVPPTFGGMDRLLEGLVQALREHHPTDLITLPFDERSREGVLRGYLDFRNLDLSDYDRVISCKAPAYMVSHPNHICYLSHRLRVFYDRYEPGDAEHERMRALIHWMDAYALDKSRIPYLYTIGETVTRRLTNYGGIESIPIHPPTTFKALLPQKGEYFLSVGRLHPWKRTDLIIRAFNNVGGDSRLKIVGEGPQKRELELLAADNPRIEFEGQVEESELAELYSRAVATVFPPINEDLGYITFESFLSGKPVITTTDAGEPSLIVEHGRTGLIAEPTAEALGAALTNAWRDRDRLEDWAEPCRKRAREVTWERVVDTLLTAGNNIERRLAQSGGPTILASRGGKKHPHHLLVTDNQIIDPPLGGGRVRILELYRHMPQDFTTTYIGAFDYPGPAPRDQQLTGNFREILTPLTAAHFKMHHLLSRLSKGDATVDVTMPILGGLTPRYRRLIEQHLPTADILIGAHPWMFPFFPDSPIPVVYDSQNCESSVKSPLLSRTFFGRWLARRVHETERAAIARSRLVLTCSDEDAREFQRRYGTDPFKLVEAPNGVDCDVICPAPPEERNAAKLSLGFNSRRLAVFTGSNYVPNLEGAEFILRKLAPAIPAVQFGIVGGVGVMFQERYPDEKIPDNVRIFGFVEKPLLLKLYRAADFALNPMFQGSGTNIKMLDYMAAGLPIITTPKGARGIKGTPDEHWIEAAPQEFEARFRELIESNETPLRMGEKARALAEVLYDWNGISERVAARLRVLIETKKT